MPGAPDGNRSPPELQQLELICFGAPTARLAGGPAPPDLLWRKHLALLIYLALSPNHSRSRSHLLGLLWPEKGEDRARHSLNEALRHLRAALGAARLESRGDIVTLTPQALEVDALRFGALASASPADALDLLRGDFLEGFAVENAPEFEDWAAVERARYRAQAAAAAVMHGEQLLARGSLGEARAAARRALALEPYAEPACRLGMRAAALARDGAGALSEYHEFAQRLERIGERPSRELDALAARVRSERWQPSARIVAVAEPSLVGRAAILDRVAEALAQGLAHGPHTLLVSGAFGTGKTRLLSDSLDRLAIDGAVSAVVRPLDSDQDTPWSSLRALLRGGLLEAPGLPGTDPRALSLLAALVPELAGRVPPAEPRDRAEVAGALASLLRAVAEEVPVALAIDDAQLCDGATLSTLHAAITRVEALPLVVILVAAPGAQSAPAELLEFQRDIGRGVPGTAIKLEPLTVDELRTLAAALAPWCLGADDRDRLARRVAFETNGNPFLAVTLLRALNDLAALRRDALEWPAPGTTLDSPLPVTAPDLVRRAIVARLVQLDAGARGVLAAASIGAEVLDLELIAMLVGVSGTVLEDRLAALERHQLLAFQGGRYVFAAPLIQRVVRAEGLTPGQAQALRVRAAAALASRTDLEARVLRAELLARTAPGPDAIALASAVARAAIAGERTRIARRALLAAEQAAQGEAGVDQSDLDALRALLSG